MKKVYICSPYRAKDEAELDRHIEYAQELTRNALMAGLIPITPHLYMTQCLDEDNQEERALGLAAGLELIRGCDFVIVGTKYGRSAGMEAEITRANNLGIPVVNSEQFKQGLKKFHRAMALEFATLYACHFCTGCAWNGSTGYECREPQDEAYKYAKTILDSGQPLP